MWLFRDYANYGESNRPTGGVLKMIWPGFCTLCEPYRNDDRRCGVRRFGAVLQSQYKHTHGEIAFLILSLKYHFTSSNVSW